VYLRDVLERLPELPAERRIGLLPDRWKPAAPSKSSSEPGRKG
jgi:hypothetical protein